MSVYEDYQTASKVYDRARRAVGVEFYLGALVRHLLVSPDSDTAEDGTRTTSLEQLSILDAGCGTGNYSVALLERGVGRVTMLDGSEGMLERARAKCARWVAAGRCEVAAPGTLPDLPYPGQHYHAVMCNQVIHHLTRDTDVEGSFPVLGELLCSIQRVLKPGGVALINYTRPEQNDSYWFINLLPKAKRTLCKRQPTLTQMKALLKQAGLTLVEVDVPLHSTLIHPDLYYHYSGVDEPEFRKLDSTWALASDEEIEQAQRVVASLTQEQINEWEDYRLRFGQCTTVLAKKM